MDCTFSKNDTNIVKGIAILAMLFHHTYPNNPGIPIYMVGEVNIWILLASSGKICVALLTMLSGYGITESYKRKNVSGLKQIVKFSLSHYIQLLSMYWCILIWSYIVILIQGGSLSVSYGVGLQGIKNFIIDLLGLGVVFHSPVFIGGWYLTAVVIYYLLFPILYYAIRKFKVLIIIITYVPWIYFIIMNDINMHTDWWLFYVFSFAFGIYLSQMEILDKQKQKRFSKTGIIFSIILFIIAFILRAYITLPMDPLLAFSIIELEIYIFSKIPVFRSFLLRCGTQSANIWLLHGVVLGLISGLCFTSYSMRFVFLMFICMGISIVIEEIKSALKYNEFVSKIRKYLA